jgi:hypothetical protein
MLAAEPRAAHAATQLRPEQRFGPVIFPRSARARARVFAAT